jgi:hypothetical protein
MIYKVSYVVIGDAQAGEIINMDTPPRVGDQVQLSDQLFEITEVVELLPPRGEFAYLHVTCRPVEATG